MQRFRHDVDAARFATRRAGLRLVLERYLGRPAASLVIDRTCRHCGAAHGKPRADNDRQLDSSVSSSGQLVAIAVARGIVVGIDVEATTTAEASLTWCCKEAVLKATGHGLAVEPRLVVIDRIGDRLAVIAAPPEHAELLAFRFVSLELPSGYIGALALDAAAASVVYFDLAD